MLMTNSHWEKPSFTDLEMNAEIGGYQGDEPDGNVPIVQQAREERSSSD
jgi:hypothetical protein